MKYMRKCKYISRHTYRVDYVKLLAVHSDLTVQLHSAPSGLKLWGNGLKLGKHYKMTDPLKIEFIRKSTSLASLTSFPLAILREKIAVIN